jgi:hypothetical protein
MSTLSPKDRVSLCMFSFADGRRCRTPRLRNHPYFCYDHAEKEARARAAQSLGTDLARYFSGEYLSACDLSTALGCLIPAVIRGDVKPRTARTVAYMAQTLLQSIHISQHEYCEAFGPDTWRKSIRNSVNSNHIYRFPPHRSGGLQAGVPPQPQHPSEPQPQTQPAAPTSPACHPERSEGSQPVPSTQQSPGAQAACPERTRRVRPEASRPASPPQPHPAQTPVSCHSERSEESASSSNSSLATHHSFIPSVAEGPLPQPLPPTAAQFAQQVLARNSSQPDRAHPLRSGEAGVGPAPQATPPPAQSQPPASTPPTSTPSPRAPSSPVCHPERSEGSHPNPGTHPASTTDQPQPTPATPPAQPAGPEQGQTNNPPNPKPPTPKRAPHKDHYAVHYDHTGPLRVDGKLV